MKLSSKKFSSLVIICLLIMIGTQTLNHILGEGIVSILTLVTIVVIMYILHFEDHPLNFKLRWAIGTVSNHYQDSVVFFALSIFAGGVISGGMLGFGMFYGLMHLAFCVWIAILFISIDPPEAKKET